MNKNKTLKYLFGMFALTLILLLVLFGVIFSSNQSGEVLNADQVTTEPTLPAPQITPPSAP